MANNSTANKNNIFATIMAGGAGTRFWPASRQDLPKQLLRLVGSRSMLQATVDRLSEFVTPDQTLVITNERLVEQIRRQLPEIPAENIVGEPAKRDTAPCIALAASLIVRKNPAATMIVMPADHVITPTAEFQRSLSMAARMVEQQPERIVTFGIRPTYAAEVFGYIERDREAMPNWDFPVYRVQRFREKPDAQTAQAFLAAGSFYWNAGIFVWKAQTILAAIKTFAPQIADRISRISASIDTPQFETILRQEFTAIKGQSIDYAVMEKHDKVSVVEAPFHWDDLGNWSALPAVRGVDSEGNTVDGKYLNLDSKNCIVFSDGDHLIVTVGMHDCIVVHTADATLVANRTDESSIKKIVESLKQREWNEYL